MKISASILWIPVVEEIVFRAENLLKKLEGAKAENKLLIKAQMSLFDKTQEKNDNEKIEKNIKNDKKFSEM